MSNKMICRLVIMTTTAFGGCASSPRVQLSAADSLDLLASSLVSSINEFKVDLEQLDRQRRKAIVDAFVTRVRTDHENPYALESHTVAFTDALNRLEADRQTACDRRQTALDNVGTLQEIADSLRRIAVESMNLDDEARRYLTGVLSQMPKTQTSSGEIHVPKN